MGKREHIYEIIAENIRKERRRLGITQAELAERADVSLDTIKSVENGRRAMSLDTYLNIVHALESSPMVLMSQQHPEKHIERFAFVPKLLEKYCKDNGYEIVAMLSEPASTEGVSFPMKYAIIGLNMEEDVNTIITLSKDMIGATDETVIDTLGKLSEYDIYVEDINGELEECYEMMYKEPVQESDIRGLVLDTVSKFYHNIRDGR